MFNIGDFAKHGRVSVRMLRHYDAIGLLRPARVDPHSGYRFYEASQLARLNRIVALKDLGFTLEQVRSILDERVNTDELRGMLRLRRAELAAAIEADAMRLANVEARLRAIESEGRMPSNDVVIKNLAPVRVAELAAPAAGFSPEDIVPVVRPLYGELFGQLERAGVTPAGPMIAYYEEGGEDKVMVHAAVPVNAQPRDGQGFAIVDLPAVDSAATILHRGSLDNVLTSYQALARWIDENGYRTVGPARELYIECPGDGSERQVTELQYPIARA